MNGDIQRPWLKHYPAIVSRSFDPERITLPQLLSRSVEAFAGRPAIEYFGTTLTYAELGEEVAATTEVLHRAGVKPGDRVAILLPNCPQHPFFFFGTQFVGAAAVHMSPLDAIRESEHKLRDSGARVLVTIATKSFAEKAIELHRCGAVETVIVCRDPVSEANDGAVSEFPAGFLRCEDLAANASRTLLLPDRDPEELALLQYTGGTTGLPKGAMLSQRNITAGTLIAVEWWKSQAGGGPDNVYLCYSPLFHALGLTGLLRRLREGALSIIRQRFDVADAIDQIEQRRISTFAGVPTMWLAIADFPGIEKRDLSSLVYLGSGSAPLPLEVSRRLEALTGHRLRGGWGMTELGGATTIPPDWGRDKNGTIGIPLPGIDMRIVDAEDPRKVLPAGEVGELCVRGPCVMSGYWNKPEESQQAFVDGWLMTGDLARMDADGYFYIVDRKKDLILSGGFNVYPLTIENAVMEHPAVSEAIAIGVPDEYRGESAKVFVVLRPGSPDLTIEELREFLKDRLGRHEMPRFVERVDEIPRTSVGKSSRKMMRDRVLGGT